MICRFCDLHIDYARCTCAIPRRLTPGGWFHVSPPAGRVLVSGLYDPNRWNEPLPLPVRPEVWTISYEVDAS